MKRRLFLSESSKALAILSFLGLPGCQQKSASASTITTNNQFMEEITILELQKGYKNGQYTIQEIVKNYLDRVDQIDNNGPALNSILEINPDALAIAKSLDDELNAGKSRGPMHGIPIILKDNIDTHDKMSTTAGSRALEGSKPLQDSFVAAQLRAAGAVILGKANLSEWANFRSNISSSGWSGLGGQTKNPYRLDRNPCGSSAGSGVAVSANLCMIAIGTETNGSIVCPSNNNGVVGIKPTVGLIGRSGIVPISETQDTAGPMARTVYDAAVCLSVLTGVDPRDSSTIPSQEKAKKDYTQFLKTDGLKGKKIGLWKGALGFHFKVDDLMDTVKSDMEAQGAEVIYIDKITEAPLHGEAFKVLLYEFKSGINKYLATLGPNAKIKNLLDLISFNEKDAVELKHFDQDLLKKSQALASLDTPEYKEALATMLKGYRENGIDKVMNENQLDAIIAPTGSPAWKTDLINGDNYLGGSSSPAARSGYPNISVPMGFVNELPVGVSIFGRAWSEPILLEIAYSYEQATKHRKKPEFLE